MARRGESSACRRRARSPWPAPRPRIVVTPDDLDADPFLLNCANGTLDLRTGELRDARSRPTCSPRSTGAAYHPDAAGAEFAKFLAARPARRRRCAPTWPGSLGHGLEGRVTEHILPIFYGAGANGKSTLHRRGRRRARRLRRRRPTRSCSPPGRSTRTRPAPPTCSALRLAILHETDQGRRLAEGTVKRLTGGDRIKARRMREDFWSFEPSHTFVMLTNHKPVISGTDEGDLARGSGWCPWDVRDPRGRTRRGPRRQARLELDAVLGLPRPRLPGLARARPRTTPSRSTAATEAYRAESDALGRFIDQRCLTGHGTVRSSELFAAWSKWCAGEGEDPGTQTAFSTELTEQRIRQLHVQRPSPLARHRPQRRGPRGEGSRGS